MGKGKGSTSDESESTQSRTRWNKTRQENVAASCNGDVARNKCLWWSLHISYSGKGTMLTIPKFE